MDRAVVVPSAIDPMDRVAGYVLAAFCAVGFGTLLYFGIAVASERPMAFGNVQKILELLGLVALATLGGSMFAIPICMPAAIIANIISRKAGIENLLYWLVVGGLLGVGNTMIANGIMDKLFLVTSPLNSLALVTFGAGGRDWRIGFLGVFCPLGTPPASPRFNIGLIAANHPKLTFIPVSTPNNWPPVLRVPARASVAFRRPATARCASQPA